MVADRTLATDGGPSVRPHLRVPRFTGVQCHDATFRHAGRASRAVTSGRGIPTRCARRVRVRRSHAVDDRAAHRITLHPDTRTSRCGVRQVSEAAFAIRVDESYGRLTMAGFNRRHCGSRSTDDPARKSVHAATDDDIARDGFLVSGICAAQISHDTWVSDRDRGASGALCRRNRRRQEKVNVKFCEAVRPVPLVAVIDRVYVRLRREVPEIVAVPLVPPLTDTPLGRFPETLIVGVGLPVALTVKVND